MTWDPAGVLSYDTKSLLVPLPQALSPAGCVQGDLLGEDREQGPSLCLSSAWDLRLLGPAAVGRQMVRLAVSEGLCDGAPGVRKWGSALTLTLTPKL